MDADTSSNVRGTDPRAIQRIDDLRTAINAEDIETSVQAFAVDAVVIQPPVGRLPQIYVGREQIRSWLHNLVTQDAQFGTLAAPQFHGERLRWSETLGVDAFRQLGLDAVEIESDAVVGEDGLITSLTIVFTPTGARRMQQAPG